MQTAIIDSTKEWTAEDYLQLEESNLPCELINGQLFMSPATSLAHIIVAGNLYDTLKGYARKTGGFAAFSPIDVYLDHTNVFQPDIVFVQKDNLSVLAERGLKGAPDLTVEILSPSNAFKDRNQKKSLYQKSGVKEYWIIGPGNRTLEIYDFAKSENPIVYSVEDSIVTSNLLPGLSFNFAELFNP